MCERQPGWCKRPEIGWSICQHQAGRGKGLGAASMHDLVERDSLSGISNSWVQGIFALYRQIGGIMHPAKCRSRLEIEPRSTAAEMEGLASLIPFGGSSETPKAFRFAHPLFRSQKLTETCGSRHSRKRKSPLRGLWMFLRG